MAMIKSRICIGNCSGCPKERISGYLNPLLNMCDMQLGKYLKVKYMKKKKEISMVRSSAAEYLTFITATGESDVNAIYFDENVWLTQKMMQAIWRHNYPNKIGS